MLKKKKSRDPGVVAHICNLSYVGETKLFYKSPKSMTVIQ
jgi:hypothetical protein